MGVVGREAARTCLVGEACAGVALAAVDSLEQNMVTVRLAAKLSRPTFAMNAQVSHSPNKFTVSGCDHTWSTAGSTILLSNNA